MDYDLPLKALDLEFELDEKAKHQLREIRSKITKRLEGFVAIIQGIIHPDAADISSIQEYPLFSESERESAQKLFNQLMKYLRLADYASVSQEEQDELVFIREVWQEWPMLKQSVLQIVKKQQLSWELAVSQEKPQGYLG